MSRSVKRWFHRVEAALDETIEVISGEDGSAPFEGSFSSYIPLVSRRFEFYRHVDVLVDVLDRVANGEIKRLLVFMPPRHGKSETISRLFSGYWVSRFPEQDVGLVSYSGELAYGFSRHARGAHEEAGGALASDASAVREWRTPQGGGLWAAGVGGPLTGRGFHLGIVDDPIRGSEEADSELQRHKLHEWYNSTFHTRAEPNAALIVVATRWHQEDLCGWLLTREPEARERWHIVNFEALKEEEVPPKEGEPPRFPVTCTVEPDWRAPGEALCPERYPADVLEHKRDTIGPRAFSALYQQRPTPAEGMLFKSKWFEIVDDAPHSAKRVRHWDTAGTPGGGDYTAGVLMSRAHSTGTFYIEDVTRGQWSPGVRDGHIRRVAEEDFKKYGHGVRITLEQEAGVAGTDRTKATTNLLAGFNVRASKVTGSKEVRADPFAAQCEAGNVKLVRGDWNTAFLDELTAFPHGRHDDQVDAVSGAFSFLALQLGNVPRIMTVRYGR